MRQATTAAAAREVVRGVSFDGPAFLRPQQQAFLDAATRRHPRGGSRYGDPSRLAPDAAPGAPNAAPTAPTDPTAAGVIAAVGIRGDVPQAFAAGSNVASFDASVTAELREAAMTTTLFCQLLADQAYPDHSVPGWAANWYATYRTNFTKLGWVVQDEQTVDSANYQTQVSVEQALVALIASTIGKQGAEAVKSALDALSNLGSGDPLITIFRTQTEQFSVDEASASVVTDGDEGFFVDLVEFAFHATGQDYEALFFHWKTTAVQYRYNKLRLSLDLAIWDQIKDAVAKKLGDKLGLINQLPDLS